MFAVNNRQEDLERGRNPQGWGTARWVGAQVVASFAITCRQGQGSGGRALGDYLVTRANSHVGVLIDRIIKERYQRMADLAEASAIDASTLSRLRSGERPLSDNHISKIAEALGPEWEQELRAAREADELGVAADGLRIGVPHSSFASNVIALLFSRNIPPGLQLATYSIHPAHSAYGDGGQLALMGAGSPRPIQLPSTRQIDLPAGWAQLSESEMNRVEFLAAEKLAEHLQAGHIDAMLAVSEFGKRAGNLESVAQTGHALSVASILVVAQQDSTAPDSKSLWERVERACDGGQKVPCYYASDTMAQYVMDNVLQHPGNRNPLDLQKHPTQVGRWSAFLEEFRAVRVRPGMAVFIGWEPQISWLQKEVLSWGRSWIAPDPLRIPDLNKDRYPERFTYVSMDLFVPKAEADRWRRSELMSSFLDVVQGRSRALNEASESADIINNLAIYFDISHKRMYEEKERMHFGAEIYLDWHRAALNQPLKR